ncbi:MarR family winged helix-turn-helix transcriptional regulator [Streptomyces qinzhouensis]|uniref:MarR family winged helix-turn-helix transcriptional regulator n=1 Tax=Streptomyces qinzhouensis TaxID=2599401 RepID=UPI001C97A87D|nr:MarR family transcriptional regulator [Streptomyces qinzhouensis]
MTLPPPTSPPASLINTAARVLARLNDRRLRPLGLTFGQMPVLAALKQGGPLSQKELARLARIEQPSMAQLLARMERDGLVERTPDPADRRVSLIALTDKGLAKQPQAYSTLLDTNNRALDGFSAQEVEVLQTLLGRLLANLDAELADQR